MKRYKKHLKKKNYTINSFKAPHAPIKAMMFDFQTLRYSSPMIDLAVFLANSTGTDVRSTHFSFIFKTYHEEVIKTMMFSMKKSRNEIPEVYNYENFLHEYARLSLYGYIIAAQFLQVLWDPEDIDFSTYLEEAQRLGKDFFVQVKKSHYCQLLIYYSYLFAESNESWRRNSQL